MIYRLRIYTGHRYSYQYSVKIISDSVPTYVAFGFQPNSELLPFFNHQIQRLLENGVIAKVRRDWAPRPEMDFGGDGESPSLGYANLAFLFAVLTVGVIGAGIATFVEAIKRRPTLLRIHCLFDK